MILCPLIMINAILKILNINLKYFQNCKEYFNFKKNTKIIYTKYGSSIKGRNKRDKKTNLRKV